MYHTFDSPEISDTAYDKLYQKLKIFEKNYPDLVIEQSPTMRVGSKLLEGFKKIKHQKPMLSLANASNFDEFLSFYTRVEKDLNFDNFVLSAEPKFDGLAISITYIDGCYFSAITRGDGIVGEDVTTNVKTIKSLPLMLDGKNLPSRLSLKAEIYMSLPDFRALNKNLSSKREKCLLILEMLLPVVLDS